VDVFSQWMSTVHLDPTHERVSTTFIALLLFHDETPSRQCNISSRLISSHLTILTQSKSRKQKRRAAYSSIKIISTSTTMFAFSRISFAAWLVSTAHLVTSAATEQSNLRESALRPRSNERDNGEAKADTEGVPSQQGRHVKEVAESSVTAFDGLNTLAMMHGGVITDRDIEEKSELNKLFMDSFRHAGFSFHPTYPPIESSAPSLGQSDFPSHAPSMRIQVPTYQPSTSSPSSLPTVSTTISPTLMPTLITTTMTPTTSICGMTQEERKAAILAMLDAVANPVLIRDDSTPQGKATTWLIDNDSWQGCPDDPKLVQRWVLAVMYFSTNGDNWYQCSASLTSTDICGSEDPFVGATRFLAPVQECAWAGISCINNCVTQVEYEANNLVGTVPTELGLLHDLQVWGMEQGGLTGPIPTQIGELKNLTFIDLDFNELTGTLPSELFSLVHLTQLDINSNNFVGNINGIDSFPSMTFLQLHDNSFTGTVPEGVASYVNMTAFTLHKTQITGTMPIDMCNLLVKNGGVLDALIADCAGSTRDIECACCTDCRRDA
jgi:hypothetical protein